MLDYAKLMRKRDKQIATEGQAPRIDMETLRASARAAEAEKSHARAQAQGGPSTSKAPGGITPPIGGGEQSQSQSQSHHQGSFQVVNMGPGGPSPFAAPTSGGWCCTTTFKLVCPCWEWERTWWISTAT